MSPTHKFGPKLVKEYPSIGAVFYVNETEIRSSAIRPIDLEFAGSPITVYKARRTEQDTFTIDLNTKQIKLPLVKLNFWYEIDKDTITGVLLDKSTTQPKTMTTEQQTTEENLISLTEQEASEIIDYLSGTPQGSGLKTLLRQKLQQANIKREKTQYFTLELPQAFEEIMNRVKVHIDSVKVPEQVLLKNFQSLSDIYRNFFHMKEEIRRRFPDVNPKDTEELFTDLVRHLSNINTLIFDTRCALMVFETIRVVDTSELDGRLTYQVQYMFDKFNSFIDRYK